MIGKTFKIKCYNDWYTVAITEVSDLGISGTYIYDKDGYNSETKIGYFPWECIKIVIQE
jgi:hypothetical protein